MLIKVSSLQVEIFDPLLEKCPPEMQVLCDNTVNCQTIEYSSIISEINKSENSFFVNKPQY